MSKTTPTEMRAIRTRLDFSKIPTSIQIPNLIEVQRRSYERFLQMDKLPREREDNGLQSVFTSVFPITDFRNVSELEFVDYSIGNWECKCGYLKGLNHSIPAMYCASSAERTTRTPLISAPSAATRWASS
jgi:DNA-directed RNA polymerase subunit beta